MEKLTLFGERTACCSNVCAECCRSWKCDSAWNGRSWKRSALKSRALRNGALLRERRFRVAEDLPYHLLAAEILRGLCRRTACGDPACSRAACALRRHTERRRRLFQKIEQVHSRNLPGCLQSCRPGILRVRETTERGCQIGSANLVLLRGQLKLHAAQESLLALKLVQRISIENSLRCYVVEGGSDSGDSRIDPGVVLQRRDQILYSLKNRSGRIREQLRARD